MDLGLKGKVAVVAASSGGLGRATAEAFAREGARVVVNGRGEESVLEAAHQIRQTTHAEVEAVVGDVSGDEGCRRLIEHAVQRFGGIDALVVNAGGPPAKPFEEISDDEWRATFDLTLMSAIRLIRYALPQLRRSEGSIVTITSTSVKQPISGLILSNGIRPGVIGLGKTLSEALAGEGVRVNSVAPGSIWTGRQEYLTELRARNQGRPLEEVKRQAEASIPMGRFGDPPEVANVVVFLSSPAASYVTGVTIQSLL